MEQIGRYKVLGELGRGAMGVVYQAQDPTIGRIVAIKIIRITELADASERTRLRDRLFREAQSAGALSHPGIVTIYDVAEQGDVAYIAMEFVNGSTLAELLASSAPPDKHLILEILKQTAAALDYAHKRGIIHRDIKPANIMIHEGSVAKITDFGVAKIQSQQATQTGTIMGTPSYMSPEQIQGMSIDGRADQFSLAVIAFQLLTGERPFRGDSTPTLLFRIVKEDPPAAHTINASLGWPVDTVLKRALAKDPQARYPACVDFIRALENACHSQKDWQPLLPGALQAMPTLGSTSSVAPAAATITAAMQEPAELAPEFVVSAEPPRFLRIARRLALVVLAAGLVSAVIVGAMHYLEPEPEAVVTEAPREPIKTFGTKPEPVSPAKPKLPASEEEAPQTAGPKESASRLPVAPVKPSVATETRLVTNPPGAEITVDPGATAQTCKSPCSLSLSPGRHTLASFLDGHRRALRIFEVPADSEVFVNLERTSGTVMVKSDPPGAAIFVNGRERPEKTPAMLTLPTGRYKIEIAKEGLKRYTDEVDVKDAVITNIAVDWN